VGRLHDDFSRRYAQCGARVYTEIGPARAWTQAVEDAYRRTAGRPAAERRAEALLEVAKRLPVEAKADDLLVGSQAFNPPGRADPDLVRRVAELGFAATSGHIVHDYESPLRCGICGLRNRVRDTQDRIADPDARANLAAFESALAAFRVYVLRHAESALELAGTLDGARKSEWRQRVQDLRHIADQPPVAFRQALQLLWLCHVFLHAENPSVAISFGRIDRILWPYLKQDLEKGVIRPKQAFELICAFLIKCCEGEESQNAVLGGVDEDGVDSVNPLSYLFLAAMRRLSTFQPSLIVRTHPDAPDDFVAAACELAARGNGNPGFMNDAVVVPSLLKLGIPLRRARDWGVVGCYEATPQGDSYPNTVLGGLHLVDVLSRCLRNGAAQSCADLESLVREYLRAVDETYRTETLPHCQQIWDHYRDHAPSPFGSVLMRGCVERATPLEGGGADYNLAGVNILGLGTVVDALHAVQDVVWDAREASLPQLAEAAAADFPDERLHQRLLHSPGRFGTDDARTNALAERLSTEIARMVLDSRLRDGVRPYPGFFRFSGDIYSVASPSPDGRRSGDLISYGVGPSVATVTSPTAILASSAHVAHGLAACGNPLLLTLQPADVRGPKGAAFIRSLTEGYFALGGSHIHFNVTRAQDLRDAQEHPERHGALTVRVSGYSARFVTVEKQWQDALIERTAKGI